MGNIRICLFLNREIHIYYFFIQEAILCFVCPPMMCLRINKKQINGILIPLFISKINSFSWENNIFVVRKCRRFEDFSKSSSSSSPREDWYHDVTSENGVVNILNFC